MTDPLTILKRADRAYHDVAQLHLHEFELATDGGERGKERAPYRKEKHDRDWRETAYLTRSNWPEAIPNSGPKREYGPYPWSRVDKFDCLDERDNYPHTHPDAASIGAKFMGDVCPRCGVPLRSDETVIDQQGERGDLAEITDARDPDPVYHVNCWKRRRAHFESSLAEFETDGDGP